MASASSNRAKKLPIILGDEGREVRIWIQLMRTHVRLERLLEQVSTAHGLSLPQFDLLATLRASEGISQQELAERLLVTKGNVCGLLDRAESAGWVERRPDAEDRRANRLFLTGEGRALLARAGPAHEAALREAMSALQPGEGQKLFQLLDRLEQGMSMS